MKLQIQISLVKIINIIHCVKVQKKDHVQRRLETSRLIDP